MKRKVDVRSAWHTAFVLACLEMSTGSACDEFGPRVYTAQRYEPELGCLESYAPLGLVEAKEIGALCEPVCLSLDDELFVSTVCPPYPATTSLEPPESEACAAALAAPSCDGEDEEDPADAGSADAGSGGADSGDAAAP